MSLLQMSMIGTVMIVAVILLRFLMIHKLSKKTFYLLWTVVMIRLLIPFQIPSPVSVYSLFRDRDSKIETAIQNLTVNQTKQENVNQTESETVAYIVPAAVPENDLQQAQKQDITSILRWIWLGGMLLCACIFIFMYVKCYKEFQMSLPIDNDVIERWSLQHPLKRNIQFRTLELVSSPLTYGVFHPTVLFPKDTNWEDQQSLFYVLEHEYVHIKRFDLVIKYIMTVTVCIHWFNPLVWMMYLLFSRDIELSCDEEVIRHYGMENRSSYAYTLIAMAGTRAGLTPFYSGFSKNSIEERITAVMKVKRKTLVTILVAATVIVGMTAMFATSIASTRGINQELKNAGMSEEEYQFIKDREFHGYQDMTITEYQEKTNESMTDDVLDLYEHLYKNNALDQMKDTNDELAFLHYIMVPLTIDHNRWVTRSFGHGFQTDLKDVIDNAQFEYTITMTILDADHLTVGQYDKTRSAIMKTLNQALEDRSAEELEDETKMRSVLEKQVKQLSDQWTTNQLKVEVTYFYAPCSIQDSIEQKPVETEDEAKDRDMQNEARDRDIEEAANNTPVTEAEYQQLLALKTKNYQKKTLREFDDELCAFNTDNAELMDRIRNECIFGTRKVKLTEEEAFFVTNTCQLSNKEIAEHVTSLHTKQKERDPVFNTEMPEKRYETQDEFKYASLIFQYSYHVDDMTKITVGDRDEAVGGFLNEVLEYWDTHSLDDLLKTNEKDVMIHLSCLASEYSTDHITINLEEKQSVFQNQYSGQGESLATNADDFADEFLDRMRKHDPFATEVQGENKASNFEDNIFELSFDKAYNCESIIVLCVSEETKVCGTITTDVDDMVPILVNSKTEESVRLTLNQKFEVTLGEGRWRLLYVGREMSGSITTKIDKNKHLEIHSA